jgi:hypothetical protein
MATETRRVRPVLLIAAGVAVAIFLLVQFWPSAAPAPSPAPRAQATSGRGEQPVDPVDLQVRLDALKEQRPGPADNERNPFRFRPPPPPPPPPPPKPVTSAPPAFDPQKPPGPPVPPPPPPITLKFMGTVEGPFGRLGAFTDCKRTFMGREGDVVDGRYKVVKIGVESATLQYVDGRGMPQTIRMSGQECVGK